MLALVVSVTVVEEAFVDVALNAAVTPFGSPDTVKETVPENPSFLIIEIVSDPDLFAPNITDETEFSSEYVHLLSAIKSLINC